jgi:geranylgeranyl diphosphate synthase type I
MESLHMAQAAAVEEQARYRKLLGSEMDAFLNEQQAVLQDVSMEALPLLDAVSSLAQGGKRLRALLSYWGWRGAGGPELGQTAVRAGVALELFQSPPLQHGSQRGRLAPGRDPLRVLRSHPGRRPVPVTE